MSADFSKETLQARRGWQEVFQVMKGKNLHPRLLYAAKLSFRMEGQIKCFSDKVKLKEFIITKPLLYEMLNLRKRRSKIINSKMTTNSQLSATEPKNKKKTNTKQTTRTGTEPEKWRAHGGFSVGRSRGRMVGGKIQVIGSINGRHKIDGERLRMV